ncbi:plasmid mobilization relaxosome protein MobC [Leifsonia sp. ZF2019]|uniref:plasmid mobilization relaxosome protein MobC n=1 Tax=Leifsonia sp. ZF2019 TaxID=2781978 RepID=UPI002E113B14
MVGAVQTGVSSRDIFQGSLTLAGHSCLALPCVRYTSDATLPHHVGPVANRRACRAETSLPYQPFGHARCPMASALRGAGHSSDSLLPRIGNNVNQIARHVNAEDEVQEMRAVKKLWHQIQGLIESAAGSVVEEQG